MSSRKRKERDDSCESRLLRLPDALLATVLSFFPIAYGFRDGPLICRRIHQVYKSCGRVAFADNLELCLKDAVSWSVVPSEIDYSWRTSRPTIVMEHLVKRGIKLHKLILSSFYGAQYTKSDAPKMLQLLVMLAPVEIDGMWRCLANQMDADLTWSFGERLKRTAVSSLSDVAFSHLLETSPNLEEVRWCSGLKYLAASARSLKMLSSCSNLRAFHASLMPLNLEQWKGLTDACSDRLEELSINLEARSFCNESVVCLSRFRNLKTLEVGIFCSDFDAEHDIADEVMFGLDMALLNRLNKLTDVTVHQWPFDHKDALCFLTSSVQSMKKLAIRSPGLNNKVQLDRSMLHKLIVDLPHLECLQLFNLPTSMISRAFVHTCHPKLSMLTIEPDLPVDQDALPTSLQDLGVLIDDLKEYSSLRELNILTTRCAKIIPTAGFNLELHTLQLYNLDLEETRLLHTNLANLVHLVHLTLSAYPVNVLDEMHDQELLPSLSARISSAEMLLVLEKMNRLQTLTLGFARLDITLLNGLVNKTRLYKVALERSPSVFSSSIRDATSFWKAVAARGQYVEVKGSYGDPVTTETAFCLE